MKVPFYRSSLAILLVAQALAAPTQVPPASPEVQPLPQVPAATSLAPPTPIQPPAPMAPTQAPSAPVPTVQPAAPQPTAEIKTELKRLMVGNQAGIVKVLGPNRQGVSYVRGLDEQSQARFTEESCQLVFQALGFPTARLDSLAQDVMINFQTLPKKEAVAFLGALNCTSVTNLSTKAKAEKFLIQVMESDKDVYARRQAILALAVKPQVESDTTERVLALYERSENLWETFPVQQYFEYHASQLRHQANFPQVRERVSAVKSLYTPAILAALDKA